MASLLANKASLLVARGNYEETVLLLWKSYEIDDMSLSTLYQLGEVYELLEQHEVAHTIDMKVGELCRLGVQNCRAP